MPTYEFHCANGHDFEHFFGRISTAPSELACPECGALAGRKISGGAGFIFKGTGFYITDYGKDGKKDQHTSVSSGSSSKDGDAKHGGANGGEANGGSADSGGTSSQQGKSNDSSSPRAASDAGSSGASSGASSGGGDGNSGQPAPTPSKPTAGE